jgi:outer membrane protein assembly factor BamD
MKKFLIIFITVLVSACAAKEPPFDAVSKFRDAEDKMHKERYEEARKAYQEIQEKAPDRSYDADIMLRIADTYFGEEKYSEAQVEYRSFLNFHPVHRDAPYAQYQIAQCSYKEITTIDRDPEVVRTALKEFQRLLEKYPRNAYEEQAKSHIALLRDRLAEYELYVGKFYHKKGSYKAALGRLERLLRDYPGSSAEKDALYYAGLTYLELGERDRALGLFETLTQKYPSMSDRVEAAKRKLQ